MVFVRNKEGGGGGGGGGGSTGCVNRKDGTRKIIDPWSSIHVSVRLQFSRQVHDTLGAALG